MSSTSSIGWDDFLSDDQIKEKLQPSVKDFKNATCLVLPSGGVKGVYVLGALEYLYTTTGIDHINTYYGTSIGAIISGLLIIGYKPIEILVYICVNKIVEVLLATFHITNILTEKRFLNSTLFSQLLGKIINDKLGYIPTLEEIYKKFGKKLCIVTISRDEPTKPLYFSHENKPNLGLDKALHMSASIPFVLGYTSYENIDYLDGGLLDPFPILYASTVEQNVFGIDIKRTAEKQDEVWWDIINILSVPMIYIEQLNKQNLVKGTYIELETKEEHTVKKTRVQLDMFISGYRQCKDLLLIKPSSTKSKKE